MCRNIDSVLATCDGYHVVGPLGQKMLWRQISETIFFGCYQSPARNVAALGTHRA